MNDDTSERSDARGGGEFLTARQLAEVLQVSDSTVLRLARAGRIPVVRLTPHLLRFHLPSVVQALAADGKHPRPRGGGKPQSEVSEAQLSFDDLM
ncbi:MAG: helix-turn-helix domain-containing protein [Pyrinomonadaceae bacterium]